MFRCGELDIGRYRVCSPTYVGTLTFTRESVGICRSFCSVALPANITPRLSTHCRHAQSQSPHPLPSPLPLRGSHPHPWIYRNSCAHITKHAHRQTSIDSSRHQVPSHAMLLLLILLAAVLSKACSTSGITLAPTLDDPHTRPKHNSLTSRVPNRTCSW